MLTKLRRRASDLRLCPYRQDGTPCYVGEGMPAARINILRSQRGMTPASSTGRCAPCGVAAKPSA